eukprot:1063951-Pelagomonas_calceolata.AAC.3
MAAKVKHSPAIARAVIYTVERGGAYGLSHRDVKFVNSKSMRSTSNYLCISRRSCGAVNCQM